MASPQKKQEICLHALRGECHAGEDCPRFHAGNRSAALREHIKKHTTQVCADHLRRSCTLGSICYRLHVLPESDIPVTPAAIACEVPNRRNSAKGAKGRPRRPVPRAVRLASQVRGKAKLFEESTAAYARLAQATGPESDYSQRALDAECQKKTFEAELEQMVARLEEAIQAYSRSASAAGDQADAATPSRCDLREGHHSSVVC